MHGAIGQAKRSSGTGAVALYHKNIFDMVNSELSSS